MRIVMTGCHFIVCFAVLRMSCTVKKNRWVSNLDPDCVLGASETETNWKQSNDYSRFCELEEEWTYHTVALDTIIAARNTFRFTNCYQLENLSRDEKLFGPNKWMSKSYLYMNYDVQCVQCSSSSSLPHIQMSSLTHPFGASKWVNNSNFKWRLTKIREHLKQLKKIVEREQVAGRAYLPSLPPYAVLCFCRGTCTLPSSKVVCILNWSLKMLWGKCHKLEMWNINNEFVSDPSLKCSKNWKQKFCCNWQTRETPLN